MKYVVLKLFDIAISAGYGLGNFIQPSLVQFQPSNLDDMDIDFEPLAGENFSI